jgi:formate dehydrogenase subunit delta
VNLDALVRMANDIGHFFDAEKDPQTAIAGIENHLRKFWDPRMRRQLHAHAQAGGAGLEPHALQAALRLDCAATTDAGIRISNGPG